MRGNFELFINKNSNRIKLKSAKTLNYRKKKKRDKIISNKEYQLMVIERKKKKSYMEVNPI